MSCEETSNYDDIDYLLEQKEDELRELGAMRVRALERTNEELKEQIEQYSDLIRAKEDENERLREYYHTYLQEREEYDNRLFKLNEAVQTKDIEISELKTTVNTYYNDLMKEK